MRLRRLKISVSIAALSIAAALVPRGATGQEPPPSPSPSSEENEARDYYQRGMAAYQRKDYLSFLENVQKAAQLSPDNPEMRFRLAAASALVGNKEDALAQLRLLVDLKIYEDLAGNPDFESLKDSADLKALIERMKGLKTRVGTSEVAFRLMEKDLIPEGLTHDPVSGDFFIGSVHKRKILRTSKRGKAKDFTTEKQDGLWAVLGIRADAQRRLLWACSTAVPQMKEAATEELGRAALFKYHLDTGAFLGKYPLGGGEKGHNCDDLAVGARGDVFISDAESSEILTLGAESGDLAVFIPAGHLHAPQGLALSEDDRYLFVADYGGGVWRVEMATRALTKLSHPPEVSLFGVDGLVYRKGSLIAVQNGITPNRVVRFFLGGGMDRVQSARILEMSDPLFDEPTLGTLTDKEFFYVANSQWSRFEKDGTIFPPNRLAEPVILKVKPD